MMLKEKAAWLIKLAAKLKEYAYLFTFLRLYTTFF